jgi:RNA polymerase sigma factor (sigma-70 family)
MAREEHESIIRRFRDGDHDAFRELVELHTPALQRRVKQKLGPAMRRKVSVTDVVQEAQLAAFENRKAFEHRGPRSFRNWLLGIVDNQIRRIRDRLRRQKREVAREITRGDRPDTVLALGLQPSPSENAIADELHARTWAAIDQLATQYRDVLRLIYRDRLDVNDAADRIGRSPAATRKLHARALLRLSDHLRLTEE